jgi:hypothetical protein
MGHAHLDTTQQDTDEVKLDELAEALPRAADTRSAQASPDLTTLEEQASDEVETLKWRRRESNPRTIPTECRDRGSQARPGRQTYLLVHGRSDPGRRAVGGGLRLLPRPRKLVRGAARRVQTRQSSGPTTSTDDSADGRTSKAYRLSRKGAVRLLTSSPI